MEVAKRFSALQANVVRLKSGWELMLSFTTWAFLRRIVGIAWMLPVPARGGISSRSAMLCFAGRKDAKFSECTEPLTSALLGSVVPKIVLFVFRRRARRLRDFEEAFTDARKSSYVLGKELTAVSGASSLFLSVGEASALAGFRKKTRRPLLPKEAPHRAGAGTSRLGSSWASCWISASAFSTVGRASSGTSTPPWSCSSGLSMLSLSSTATSTGRHRASAQAMRRSNSLWMTWVCDCVSSNKASCASPSAWAIVCSVEKSSAMRKASLSSSTFSAFVRPAISLRSATSVVGSRGFVGRTWIWCRGGISG
mmetsp:Transcript_9603/g.35961  ORF Transcript_9603/g.35961 Transcript_9603/m.35961 type:complete len:310 (+) Transcript_9603:611-1540(+)